MKLHPPDPPAALGHLMGWFDTVATVEGYTGPVVGLRNNCLRFTGPGNDWRLEGLLDGYIFRYHATGDSAWLELIRRDLNAFLNSRRLDGTFENSYFDMNPFEGGMPHEPAVLAAAARASRLLTEAGQPVIQMENIIQDSLERIYTSRLWNKSMGFVRNWEISEFEWANAASCAAVLDLILEWEQSTRDTSFQSYADSLTRFLINLQAASGGIPDSNRRGAGISPFLASRCLRPLRQAALLHNHETARRAADKLATFLIQQAIPEGGFKRLLWSWRPSSVNPIVTGASSGILNALLEDGCSDNSLVTTQQNWLLGLQTPSGAFRHAIGYGQLRPNSKKSDWRDWIASPGWQDKIFLFLCRRCGKETVAPVASQTWETPTRVCGQPGIFRESPDQLEIFRKETPVYRWKKKERFAEVCQLT